MPVSFEARPAPAKATTVSIEARPAPAKAMPVSTPHRHNHAKATPVSDNRPSWPTGPGCGAGGRRQGLAGLRDDTPSHTPATQRRRCEGRRRDRRARAGFEIDHSEPLGSRVAISRAARTSGARNTSGATNIKTRRGRLAGGPPPTGTPSDLALRRPEHQRRPQHNETRPRPVSRPRPRHAHAAPFTTAPPAIRRSCPRDPRPRRGQPRGGRRGRGTGSRTRSRHPRCGRSGSTAGRHRARHTRRA